MASIPQYPNPHPPLSPPESPSGSNLHDDIFSDSPPSSPRLSSSTTTTTAAATTTHSQSDGTRIQPSNLNLPPDLFKLKSTHNTQGYLAGLTASKPNHIQAGFDEGYEFGGKLGMVVGWIRGVGEGLVAMRPEDRRVRAVVRDLEREVTVERVFAAEFVDGEGKPRWEVGKWEGGEGGAEGGAESDAEDVDLVVQSHPLVRKWVGKVVGLAKEVGLDVVGGGGAEEGDKGAGRVEGDK